MYALADIDFSDRLGIVISELPFWEMDQDQEQTLDAMQGATPSDLATPRDLEVAVFTAA